MPVTMPSQRRTFKAPDNPMDRCTIVNISPLDIDETKHTIQPGRFKIPAGSYANPSILVVGPSSWWKELEEDQPLLEIVNNSMQVANSIVDDYVKSLLYCSGDVVCPGLFFIPGEFKLADILTKHRGMLDKYQAAQKRWYAELVKAADSLWARSNGNPTSVNDLQRLAAKELGQNDKDWLQNFQATETVLCIACGQVRNPKYPICPNCKTNVPEYEKNIAIVAAGKKTA